MVIKPELTMGQWVMAQQIWVAHVGDGSVPVSDPLIHDLINQIPRLTSITLLLMTSAGVRQTTYRSRLSEGFRVGCRSTSGERA